MSTRVVALLPARNAAEDLPGWFDSIEQVADAVVALDDGSTDATADLLARHPLVEVLLRNPRRDTYAGWDDGANRNRLLEAADALCPDWVLSLDTDERVVPDDAHALRDFLETDALKSVVYAFRVYRMLTNDTFDLDGLIVRRLFAWQPGQRFPDQRLHPVPVPTHLLDAPWLLTTVRIQHLAGVTEERRTGRYEKYREADPDCDYQESYEHLLESPGRPRVFETRPRGLPVLGKTSSSIELDAPVLSAIVIARNRDAGLLERVQAVVEQECPEPFEVIVVASGPGHAADEVRDRFPEVRVVALPELVLPGAARNAGLDVARGDIISFPGSHVTLEPGSLAARIRAHQRGFSMVTGTTLNGTTTRAGWAAYFLDNSTALPGGPSGELRSPPAHCSYLRHTLDEVGGFPEHLRAGEDTVVNHELTRRGYRAFRADDAVLVHHNPCRSTGALLRHHFTRGRAFGRILLDRNRGDLLRRESRTLRGYVRRRQTTIDRQVAQSDDSLRDAYRRARPLVRAGALASWTGTWFELFRPEPGNLRVLWGREPTAPLVFVHVPRTGGTSVVSAIEAAYDPNAVLRIYDGPGVAAELLAQLTGREKESLRAVVGHIAYGAHEHLPGARYVTFVRDPVERVISHYNFVRTHPELPGHDRALDGITSLEEYVTASPHAYLVNNGMTRLLGGELSRPGVPPTTETLARAKRNLDGFAFVGVQERFDESMQQLADVFGWPPIAPVRENAGIDRPTRADLPPATVELIEARNQLDIALYEHVISRDLSLPTLGTFRT
jgi:glycosyltransferase involved in cell wall biosynthesis